MMECVFNTIFAEDITVAFYLTFSYVDLNSFWNTIRDKADFFQEA